MRSEAAKRVARHMIADYLMTSTMFWGAVLISLMLSGYAVVYTDNTKAQIATMLASCSPPH